MVSTRSICLIINAEHTKKCRVQTKWQNHKNGVRAIRYYHETAEKPTRLASGHFSAASIMHSPIFFNRHVTHWPSLDMRKQTDAVAQLYATLRRQPLGYTYVGISS